MLIFYSCESVQEEIESIPQGQFILFQYEYVNHAWGFQHSGWFINSDGKITGYSLPMEWKWNNSSNFISKDSLEFNYNQAETILTFIDTSVLDQKKELIDGTINGKLSKLESRGADMGSFLFYCYAWDDSKKMYRKQLLSKNGDRIQVNTEPEAKELALWLASIFN